MGLSKNFLIMKALIEECLRRGYEDRTENDIKMCLEVLKVLLPHNELYLVADSMRFVEGFAEAMGRPYTAIREVEQAILLSNIHVIILQMGGRTNKQRQRYKELREALMERPEIVIWHIGAWFV